MSARSKTKQEGEVSAKPVREASELPEGWTHCRVDKVFNVFSGGTPSRSEPRYWNGNVTWLSSGDIKTDEIEVGSEFITEAGFLAPLAPFRGEGLGVRGLRKSGFVAASAPSSPTLLPSGGEGSHSVLWMGVEL